MNPGIETRYRCALLLVAATLACSVCGCLTFEQRWQEASHHLTPANSIAGRWQGYWTSDEHSRRGELRCIVTPLRGGDYEARFCTVFAFVVPWEYTIGLHGKTEGGLLHFAGKQNLGWLWGGVHTYEGKAGSDRLFATYASRKDKGSIELTRPE